MKITKLGHCCLLIEEKGRTILTDPGAWTTAQNEVTGIDIILITHEHPDHLHLESLKTVLTNNPQAIIITNSSVGKILTEATISFQLLEDQQAETFQDIHISGFGQDHAVIYPTLPVVQNTGYMIEKRFFYPGDAFPNISLPVEILAVPIIGPWMTMAQALDWAIGIQPKIAFPVHDGMLNPREWIYKTPMKILGDAGIQFDPIEPKTSREY